MSVKKRVMMHKSVHWRSREVRALLKPCAGGKAWGSRTWSLHGLVQDYLKSCVQLGPPVSKRR